MMMMMIIYRHARLAHILNMTQQSAVRTVHKMLA